MPKRTTSNREEVRLCLEEMALGLPGVVVQEVAEV